MQLQNATTTKITKIIGLFEGLKGLAALAAAFGFLSLLHHNMHQLALEFIGHFGLNPAAHYPHILLEYVDKIAQTKESSVIILAFSYAAMRLTEGVGLWLGKAWGEWLAAVSGGIYLPFEMQHILHKPSWAIILIFLFNLTIVIYLVRQLWMRKNQS